MPNLWLDIQKRIYDQLIADTNVTSLVNTIRIGEPINSIPSAQYPVIVLPPGRIADSEYRASNEDDRTNVWTVPLYFGTLSTTEALDLPDGSGYVSHDAIVQATLTSIFSSGIFKQEPFYQVEIIDSVVDQETKAPYIAETYFLNVTKINKFSTT